MNFVWFPHSILADWNNGNAHFLRGVCRELAALGHAVRVFESDNGWSLENQLRTPGGEAALDLAGWMPQGVETRCFPAGPDAHRALEEALDGADVVVVHEWNPPGLIAQLGRYRAEGGTFRLFFHDTHHRGVSSPEEMSRYDLSAYDGVLAFGAVLRNLYLERGWSARAWTWHEGADTALFHPPAERAPEGDLVWIGNWGDDERADELEEYLFGPCERLAISGTVYGVRYPENTPARMARAGLRYRGWLPNALAPEAFAAHRVTVHIPRRHYAQSLPGIPTIRVFEALACGIPLVCAPWEDAEGLFTPGRDFLFARTGREMEHALREVLSDAGLAESLALNGLAAILKGHTCRDRVVELLNICAELNGQHPTKTRTASAGEQV